MTDERNSAPARGRRNSLHSPHGAPRGPHLSWKIRYRILLRFFSQTIKLSNFSGLVIGSFGTDFCNEILILLRLSRSTRLPHLCTTRNWKSQQKLVKLFRVFVNFEFSEKICFRRFWSDFLEISRNTPENISNSWNFRISDRLIRFGQFLLNSDRILPGFDHS